MLKCSQMFSDSMVLQREKCIAVWGTGEDGKIKFTNINNYRKISLCSCDDELIEEVEAEGDYLHGYVYEFEACGKAISKGLIQAPEMPWSRTGRICQINDTIRSMM